MRLGEAAILLLLVVLCRVSSITGQVLCFTDTTCTLGNYVSTNSSFPGYTSTVSECCDQYGGTALKLLTQLTSDHCHMCTTDICTYCQNAPVVTADGMALADPSPFSCDQPTPAWPAVTTIDVCGPLTNFTQTTIPAVLPSGPYCDFTYQRVYTTYDTCENSAQTVQTIRVKATEGPTFSNLPADTTLSCGDDITLTNPTAQGQCTTATVVLNSLVNTTDASCVNNFAITRTWTATDGCGLQTTASSTVSVRHTTPPTMSSMTASDRTIILNQACNNIPNPDTLTVTGYCGKTLPYSSSDVITNQQCQNRYTIVRTYTATDECGLSTSNTQNIQVRSVTSPTLTVQSDVTVTCDAVPTAVSASASGHCGVGTTVTLASSTRTDGTCPQRYSLRRTWRATDACGLSTETAQNVVVTPKGPPTFTFIPASVTVNCDTDIANTANTGGKAIAQSPCDPDVTVTYTDTNVGKAGCSLTVVRRWVATDNCGAQATAEQNITVGAASGTVKITAPDDTNVAVCPGASVSGEFTGEINVNSLCLQVSDVSVTHSDTVVFSGDGTRTLLRKWTARDICGNEDTDTQYLFVVESRSVSMSSVAEETVKVTLAGDCGTLPAPPTVTAAKQDGTSLQVTYTENKTPGRCPYIYNLTRVWTASDECGNTATKTQTLEVDYAQLPVLSTTPSDITVLCDSIPSVPVVTASGACGMTPTVKLVEEGGKTCPLPSSLTRRWTATDQCGKSTTHAQTIQITSAGPPTFSYVPANVQTECSSAADVISVGKTGGIATATSRCDPTVQVTYADTVLSDDRCKKTIRRTWTATDDCQTTTTASQTIDVTISSGLSLTLPQNTNLVVCQGDSIAAAEVGSTAKVKSISPCLEASEYDLTYDDTMLSEDAVTGMKRIQRTWVATDVCGNKATGSQLLTVSTVAQPSLALEPASLAISCSSLAEVRNLPLPQLRVSGSGAQVQKVEETTNVQGACAGQIINRTFKVTMDCGYDTTLTQSVIASVRTASVVTQPVYLDAQFRTPYLPNNQPSGNPTWTGTNIIWNPDQYSPYRFWNYQTYGAANTPNWAYQHSNMGTFMRPGGQRSRLGANSWNVMAAGTRSQAVLADGDSPAFWNYPGTNAGSQGASGVMQVSSSVGQASVGAQGKGNLSGKGLTALQKMFGPKAKKESTGSGPTATGPSSTGPF
ncbi:mucin-5B-like [Lingula anatina]|uniref:Mucin-5B-like n=1 Tax=Lingula anatina TaxID=7574 RepID=A0A1S3J1V8_LINAN|nr:mucin-5B-like [Lingula anatina]|eukprot:XP_013403809.1 mucin-5B-like [Lingula anatina]